MTELEQKIQRHLTAEDGHLLWDGFMLKGRYPVLCYRDHPGGSKTVRVARYLYEQANGPIGGNLIGLCKLLRCVEPTHHAPASATKERRSRGRRTKVMRRQRAEFIRKLAGEGFSAKEISLSLNLSFAVVSRVVRSAR